MKESLKIAIAGATGYVGIQLIKILLKHPRAEIVYLCAKKSLGKKINYFPSFIGDQIKIKPVYKRFDGWLKSTRGIKEWKKLPKNAQKYVSFIKKFCNVKISSISTSPKREDTILLENPFK